MNYRYVPITLYIIILGKKRTLGSMMSDWKSEFREFRLTVSYGLIKKYYNTQYSNPRVLMQFIEKYYVWP